MKKPTKQSAQPRRSPSASDAVRELTPRDLEAVAGGVLAPRDVIDG